MHTLETAKVPVYLPSIIQDHLQRWMVFAQTVSGMKKRDDKYVPQGLVLGALLCNIAFNDILKEDVPLTDYFL